MFGGKFEDVGDGLVFKRVFQGGGLVAAAVAVRAGDVEVG